MHMIMLLRKFRMIAVLTDALDDYIMYERGLFYNTSRSCVVLALSSIPRSRSEGKWIAQGAVPNLKYTCSWWGGRVYYVT